MTLAAVLLSGGAAVAGPAGRLVAALRPAAAGGAGPVDADQQPGRARAVCRGGPVRRLGLGAASERGSLPRPGAALAARLGALVRAALVRLL